jgi:ribosomal protein S18 acetylase RimI-like enzyme
VNVRRGSVADARAVAEVHVQSWQAAYRDLVPQSYLDTLSVDTREKFWREAIEREGPELWLAETDGSVVGWVAFGPSRDPDADGSVGEISAIYLLPSHWSTGIGLKLWLTARARLIELGFATVTLWVFAENSRAIRFYRAAGFEPMPESEQRHERGGKSLLEQRYICRLD